MTTRSNSHRLYCLVAGLDPARAVVATLRQAGITAPAVRVITRRETLFTDLSEASLRERSGIVEAARRGALMGSVAGTIAGIVAAIELPGNWLVSCGVVVFGGIGGSAFGAWASAMMGIEEPHSSIRPYQQAIESGQVLILIDVAADRIDAITALLQQQHPDARITPNTADR